MSIAELKALIKEKQKDLDHKKTIIGKLNKSIASFRETSSSQTFKLQTLNDKYDNLLKENNSQY